MKDNIYQELSDILTRGKSKKLKLCVMGIGSDLRGDVATGILVVHNLSKIKNYNIFVLYGATAPENFTGEIKKIRPSHLIIVDCADLGLKPGEIKIVEEKNIEGVSFSTHTLPISVMIRYLKEDMDFETIVIGIQPVCIDFGASVSFEVERASVVVSDVIAKVLREKC